SNIMMVQMNQAHPHLSKPQVRQAIKWAIDYRAIQTKLVSQTHATHQNCLPAGFPAALTDLPFQKDVAKAKALMPDAGLADGFEVVMDHYSNQPAPDIAQAIQADLAAIGIRVRLMPGESRQVLTKNRARTHDMILSGWGADYFDPNTNAEAFCVNPDNSA